VEEEEDVGELQTLTEIIEGAGAIGGEVPGNDEIATQ
jgi:hypothetical protein